MLVADYQRYFSIDPMLKIGWIAAGTVRAARGRDSLRITAKGQGSRQAGSGAYPTTGPYHRVVA